MGWFLRRGDTTTLDDDKGRIAGPVVRPAPGVSALFDGLVRDERRSLLDLGSAAEENLHFYNRFARRIRFAGLLDGTTHDLAEPADGTRAELTAAVAAATTWSRPRMSGTPGGPMAWFRLPSSSHHR